MSNSLEVVVTDPDPDYLGIEIYASSSRFSGATKIFAGLEQLSEFAKVIEGFPSHGQDQRRYIFGTREVGFAGGYCALRFYSRDDSGHCLVEVEFEDDDSYHSEASAKFSFPVLPAEVDRFVDQLRSVERAGSGGARIENKG